MYLIQTNQLSTQLDQYIQENTALSEIAKERAREVVEKNKMLEQKLEEKQILEDYLRNTVEQKEVLLREVQHRVKNNLSVMVGMLNLQLQQNLTDEMKDFIEKNKNRIITMATAHEICHEDQNFEFMDLNRYLKKMTLDILASVNQHEDIETSINIEKTMVNQETAISCGLVLNECVTNSVKHAFTEMTDVKKIVIEGNSEGSSNFQLTIADNGKGFQTCTEPPTPHESFGLWLVKNIVEGQLEGTAQCESRNGTKWIIRFPLPEVNIGIP